MLRAVSSNKHSRGQRLNNRYRYSTGTEQWEKKPEANFQATKAMTERLGEEIHRQRKRLLRPLSLTVIRLKTSRDS